MNRNHWKHLQAAARSVGSALNLKVETITEGEDYPQLVIAGGVVISFEENNLSGKWVVEEVVTTPATREEPEDCAVSRIGEYAPKLWNKALIYAFKRVAQQIIENVVEAEALAEQFDAEILGTHLRKVD
jgi:hypothetical protein